MLYLDKKKITYCMFSDPAILLYFKDCEVI